MYGSAFPHTLGRITSSFPAMQNLEPMFASPLLVRDLK
jgi:hypothetical protein